MPVEWGKLARNSFTYTAWFGADPGTCAEYPYAAVFRFAPVAFNGSTPAKASFNNIDLIPGDCTATQSLLGGNTYVLYESGAHA